MLKPTNNITLENVKNSNYWELIALIVWNHYREEKYQDESSIKITEDWYGKHKSGGSYNIKWNNPEFKEEGYVRTLYSIQIEFTRNDYITYIDIKVETGNISYFGIYTDKSKKRSPNYSPSNINLMNWMLENKFIELV